MRLGPLSRERWRVLEPLLDAALDRDGDERTAFLDDACRGDDALRAELEALIAGCEAATGVLDVPAVERFAPLLVERETPMPAMLGGRYQILRELGRGGMATVYLADDLKHCRQVAVKALHGHVARAIGRERFAREIEIAAGLSHPHILPLHDSGEETPSGADEDSSLLYFVAPFAAGESVRDRLRRGPRMTPSEVARLGREIALALDYAHRRGVVHLDVKPDNILLQDGHALIADFGIARATSLTDGSAAEQCDTILGTPHYMSPEQAAGLPDVDGRSDVYSLGCVLYELLAEDRPPVGGTTPTSRPMDGPPELAAVVYRAMSPKREDRYATAADLARALTAAMRQSRLPRRRRVVGVRAFGALAVLAAGLTWMALRPKPLDADLVAVAPFDVPAGQLALWREGLVDVISRSLDGAGALRAVPASSVIQHWTGRADATSARALGKATGARLVIYGGLFLAGDSVRASVSLLDAQTGRTIAELDRRDVAERIDRMADSLTIAVLRELGRSRRLEMAHATEWPTSSLGALKAYLRGEQFYRAALWDSAQTNFERALAQDSTFALAYHRLAAVRRWRDVSEVPDSATYELMRRPSLYPRGLGPRERLLARIDSLSAETYFAWRRGLRTAAYRDEEAFVRRLYAMIESGIQRYPNDAELAYLLAEAKSRYEGDVAVGEVDDRAILALYDRAIALDSSFAPAYVTPIARSAYLDGPASAQRYIAAYLTRVPRGPRTQVIRVADMLLDPVRSASVDMGRLVDTLSSDALCQASAVLRHAPAAGELTLRMARALASRRVDPETDATTAACAYANVVDELQFHGRLREAHRLTATQAHWLRPTVVYNMARAGIIPPDSIRAEAARIRALGPKVMMSKLYGWWATDGDTASIESYIDHFTGRLGHLRTPSGEAMLQASIVAGRAHLALARRDTAGAVKLLLTARDTLHECWYDDRLQLVQLLVASGQLREAEHRLQRRWPGTTSCSNGYDDVVWTLERARVLERRGKRQDAARDYAFVAESWRGADAELQRYVAEARAGAARLEGRWPMSPRDRLSRVTR